MIRNLELQIKNNLNGKLGVLFEGGRKFHLYFLEVHILGNIYLIFSWFDKLSPWFGSLMQLFHKSGHNSEQGH